ncbi:MAG TPA: GNAT family protein [Nocardioides sp.]
MGRWRALGAWAEALGVDVAALERPGVHVVERTGATTDTGADAVVVLVVGDSCIVACPPDLVGAVRALPLADLLAAERLAELLPVPAHPLGTATLAFIDAPPPAPPHAARRATPDDVEEVRTRVGPDEWDESGLADLTERWAVPGPDGCAVALAGFSPWREHVAQLGVVAVPEVRGRGYARSAATAAVTHALAEGLVVQWRSSIGNTTSARLGAALGCVPIGRQSAVLLGVDAG